MSRKCPGYVPVKPDSRESMQGLSARGGRSGSRLGFASRATPCTASAFVLILRTHTRCKSRNPYKARRTAAEFARWSAWSCPRRMSASISRSRNSMPRNRNPLRRRSRCRNMRAADEAGRAFIDGIDSVIPRSWVIRAPCRANPRCRGIENIKAPMNCELRGNRLQPGHAGVSASQRTGQGRRS